VGTGLNVIDGVAEVTISYTVSGEYRDTVEDWASDELSSVVGVAESTWDHVMFVLPSSVDFAGSAAYAYIGWSRSVYRDNSVAVLLVQVHEIGHNLNMRHSGLDTETYGDTTCFEGAHLFHIMNKSHPNASEFSSILRLPNRIPCLEGRWTLHVFQWCQELVAWMV
jgi:hypothetical protein